MTRIEITRQGYIVWLWSKVRRRWEMPLGCATLLEALRLAEKLSA
jgi:hypothetical protein